LTSPACIAKAGEGVALGVCPTVVILVANTGTRLAGWVAELESQSLLGVIRKMLSRKMYAGSLNIGAPLGLPEPLACARIGELRVARASWARNAV